MSNILKNTIMKKLFTYLTMTMAFAAMPFFTSCDARFWEDVEDRAEARTLEGTWSGYIDTYFYDRFGISGDTYRTSMYFPQPPQKSTRARLFAPFRTLPVQAVCAGNYSGTAVAIRATSRFAQATASETVGRMAPLSRTVARAAS